MNNNFGENIKKIRKMKNLTQRELGELLGFSQAAIGQFESGKSNLTMDTVKKIASALEVTEWHILYGMTDEEVLEKMRNNRKEYVKRFKEKKEAEEKTAAVRKYLLDEKTGLFVSGEEKQINYASQVWLILAGAVSIEEGSAMLDKLDELKPEKGMVSPYMNHHYVEALLMCGKKDQAMEYMKYYWGGMISHGADTFWELYNPENPAESPYGSSIVNSYCHAWSCTPTYLLRKYFA